MSNGVVFAARKCFTLMMLLTPPRTNDSAAAPVSREAQQSARCRSLRRRNREPESVGLSFGQFHGSANRTLLQDQSVRSWRRENSARRYSGFPAEAWY